MNVSIMSISRIDRFEDLTVLEQQTLQIAVFQFSNYIYLSKLITNSCKYATKKATRERRKSWWEC